VKIVLINSAYYPNVFGGAERSVQHLAEALTRAGQDVVIISLGSEYSTSFINGVKVHYVPLYNIYLPFDKRPPLIARFAWNLIDIWNPIMAQRLGRIIAQERPDIVHTNTLLGFSVSAWGEIKRQHVPIVHTLRDHSLLCPRTTMFKAGNNCQSQCLSCKAFSFSKKPRGEYVDAVVGISRYILDRHLTAGWFSTAQASVIHNSFRAVEPTARHSADRLLKFGFLGRLTPGKGIELLIRSFMQVPVQSARLRIGGAGHADYVRRLRAGSDDSRIEFVGYIAREQFYQSVDVVIVPSLHNEALGRVILEAYAYGCPVVASNRGGIPEIVTVGQTGFLFDPSDESQLVDLLTMFALRPDLVGTLTQNCLNRATDFQESTIAESYLRVYEHGLSSVNNSSVGSTRYVQA
jgi:glycosyltransferase involved in cell wall biosynthesis